MEERKDGRSAVQAGQQGAAGGIRWSCVVLRDIMTQNEAILAALKKGKRLTPLDALCEFGCNRLAARVLELRQAGHDIRSQMVKRGIKKVSSYWLVK
jgi:hypothetical protein